MHFGHANIVNFCQRPVRDIEQMNEVIISNWNSVVGEGDTVYVLGDVALGKIGETLPLVGLLNGTKHLIAGNHDRCWHGHKKGVNAATARYLDAGFHSVEQHGAMVLRASTGFSVGVLLHHFPYDEDSRHADRYSEHRPEDNGSWLLHGHVHTEWVQKGRQINVGTDVWGMTPVSESQIMSLIMNGPNTLWGRASINDYYVPQED
jgi:calcineurin-like phosphoesterase family protein